MLPDRPYGRTWIALVVLAACGFEPTSEPPAAVIEPFRVIARAAAPMRGSLTDARGGEGQGRFSTGGQVPWEGESPSKTGPRGSSPPERAEINAALDFVRARAGIASGHDDWRLRSIVRGADGLNHLRFDQIYDGIPVWGADLVVHADGAGVVAAQGTVVRDLAGLATTPVLTAADALAAARRDYAAAVPDPSAHLTYDRETARLVIVPVRGGSPRLAWHAMFFTERQGGKEPGLWHYLIAADDGALLDRVNLIDTLSQASGAGGNPKVSRQWVDALDVEPAESLFAMSTARMVTFDMGNGTTGGTIVTGPLAGIGDAVINDAHGFAEKTLDMMMEWYGYRSIDDAGFVIHSRVHYDRNYDNAFWDGRQMTYGDGAAIFYPLSGDVDVVAHEINHGFTAFHSNLFYAGESGGNNEAFSDIAGAIAEFYTEGGSADFDVGRDIVRGNAALRYMCTPTADGRSIDHVSSYFDGLDVHYSSGIMNKAFCRSARRLSSGGSPIGAATAEGVRRAGAAWYLANAAYWTATSNFVQACEGVMDAARGLGFTETELGYLLASWREVGVDCDNPQPPASCDETLTAAGGVLQSPGYPTGYPDEYDHTWCIRPDSGEPATLVFDDFRTEEGFDFVTITDGNNGRLLDRASGATAPAPTTSSFLMITFTSDARVREPGWHARWSTGTNQAPTVAITAPAHGSTVAGYVAVTAEAADVDGAVQRVRFDLPDGTSVDDTTAPYALTWWSKTVRNGSYAIRARAFDDLQAVSDIASVTVDIVNDDCDDVVTGVMGTLQSPNYPRPYPRSQDWVWCIRPNGGVAATLYFRAFSLYPDEFDRVIIRDGNTGQVLATAYDQTPPPMTTSSFLKVRFRSNHYGDGNGWQAVWVAAGANLPPVVTNDAPRNGLGIITLSATARDDDGTVARVRFELPDGSVVDDTAPPFAVSWNTALVPDADHPVRVQAFDDDGAGSEVATAMVFVRNCHWTLADPSGTVQSPNHPAPYPGPYNRRWCIRAPQGQIAKLRFDAFDTQPTADYIEITDGTTWQVLTTASGTVAPPETRSSVLIIKFVTDAAVNRSGWRATWSSAPAATAP